MHDLHIDFASSTHKAIAIKPLIGLGARYATYRESTRECRHDHDSDRALISVEGAAAVIGRLAQANFVLEFSERLRTAMATAESATARKKKIGKSNKTEDTAATTCKQTKPQPLEPRVWPAEVEQIAAELSETAEHPKHAIAFLIRRRGLAAVLDALEETKTIERKGGLMTGDCSRRRTRGGVFFRVAKTRGYYARLTPETEGA